MRRNRNAKILATLGPATSNPQTIRELFLSGVDVFRLNFSHGSYETHKKNHIAIRQIEEDTSRQIGILLDLQGPKLRIGKFLEDQIILEAGKPK